MTARRWAASIIALCAVAMASFAVSYAISSRQAAARVKPVGKGPALITSYLQLSPEQEERVASINESFRPEQHAACAEMQEDRANLLAVLQQPHPRQQDIDTALANLEKSQARLQRRAAQYLLDLKPVLREDQQKKLFDLVGQRFCDQGRCGGGICPGIGRPGCYAKPGCMR